MRSDIYEREAELVSVAIADEKMDNDLLDPGDAGEVVIPDGDSE